MHSNFRHLVVLFTACLLLMPLAAFAEEDEGTEVDSAEAEQQAQIEAESDAEDEALNREAIARATGGAVSATELEANSQHSDESEETIEPEE